MRCSGTKMRVSLSPIRDKPTKKSKRPKDKREIRAKRAITTNQPFPPPKKASYGSCNAELHEGTLQEKKNV